MKERELACLAFTRRGAALAERICRALGGRADCTRDLPAFSLSRWTKEQFEAGRALVFVGAVGIAVRAVAPFLRSKVSDPPVVALDEGGRFVIPLVSGHLGGANELAREIARLCGGAAVITTATDLNGLFAVDLWAKRQGLTICQPERIKTVSGKLLAGETIRVCSRWPVAGTPPEGVKIVPCDGDVTVDVRPGSGLCLAPPVLTLGVGCRRGTSRETMEEQFARFCAERSILPQAVCTAASIDRKQEEAGLLAFCKTHGWRTQFYTAAELKCAPGTFTPSDFVRQTVGVDNVCERAAALTGGTLLERKYAQGGVTFALSLGEVKLDWSW